MSNELLFFSGFVLFITAILVLDLTVIGRKSHVISFKEAGIWSVVWISLAFLFYVFILFHGEKIHGIVDNQTLTSVASQYAPNISVASSDYTENLENYRKNMAIMFLSGYFIEKTLSIDNIFVIIMLLSAFSVPEKNYKHVLFWGILGAIILRCIFIFAGSALIQRFSFILLIFGGFLVLSGIKMFLERNKVEKIEPENHWLVKFLSKHFPVYPKYVENKFFVVENAKRFITPLFVVLVLIEFTDLIFAFDSIPAIFSISIDPYIVFFSNIFAIIGLRSLFFLLIKIIDKFHYLKVGVSFLLVFVGIKLLIHTWLDNIGFRPVHSLIVILFTLVASVVLSLVFPKKQVA